MLKRVKDYVSKWQMLTSEDRVIVGVSGGADSVCLLFVLMELQKEIPFDMVVVHVNHGLRGEAADADEAYVKELCLEHGILCESYFENVELFAKNRKQSTEEAGREVRRACFQQAMQMHQGTKIALAHHKNDSAETFLFHLARGTGIKGLGGIAPVKDNVIRPLLCVNRKEIEEYLKNRKIFYCTDQTNASDEYTRNRVRNHVISYMEEHINEKTVEHINDTMEQLRQIREYLDEQIQNAWERSVSKTGDGYLVSEEVFRTLPNAIQPLLLRKVLADVSGQEKDLESVHLKQLQELFDRQTGRKVDLPYQTEGKRVYQGVEICPKEQEKEKLDEEIVYCTEDGHAEFSWGESTVRCRVLEDVKNTQNSLEKSNTKWFDYDIMKNNISFRTRRPGDYITIHPDGKTQKLKSYFINKKIPQGERDKILLVADGNHIIWIVGYRVNPMYQIQANTNRILEIQIDEGEKHGRAN